MMVSISDTLATAVKAVWPNLEESIMQMIRSAVDISARFVERSP